MNDFVGGIQARAEFYNLAKHGNDATVNSKCGTDPVAGFIDQCKTENVLVLSTISKIKEMSLDLKDYKLNAGLAKALGQTFSSDRNMLQRLVLENNGLSDELLAKIMQGTAK